MLVNKLKFVDNFSSYISIYAFIYFSCLILTSEIVTSDLLTLVPQAEMQHDNWTVPVIEHLSKKLLFQAPRSNTKLA